MAHKVSYNSSQPEHDIWLRWITDRVKMNKNNLIAITGQTGSGKTYSAMSCCEQLAKFYKKEFNPDDVIFTFTKFMKTVTPDTVYKGQPFIFDEPQVSISAREFQSMSNRFFNYILSTFRQDNLTIFFCLPYVDMMDKNTRKLLHAHWETQSINTKNNTCRVKPKLLQYSQHTQKFYTPFLKVFYKPVNKIRHIAVKIKAWDIPKPSQELCTVYEERKLQFRKELQAGIVNKLENVEKKEIIVVKTMYQPTEKMIEYSNDLKELGSIKKVAEKHNITVQAVTQVIQRVKNKAIQTHILENPPIEAK